MIPKPLPLKKFKKKRSNKLLNLFQQVVNRRQSKKLYQLRKLKQRLDLQVPRSLLSTLVTILTRSWQWLKIQLLKRSRFMIPNILNLRSTQDIARSKVLSFQTSKKLKSCIRKNRMYQKINMPKQKQLNLKKVNQHKIRCSEHMTNLKTSTTLPEEA